MMKELLTKFAEELKAAIYNGQRGKEWSVEGVVDEFLNKNASQFKTPPALGVKEVSDEEIKKEWDNVSKWMRANALVDTDVIYNWFAKRMRDKLSEAGKKEGEYKALLREVAMRANCAMPETEQDEQWFEEKFAGSPHDFMINLYAKLGLGILDDETKDRIFGEEKISNEIMETVYGPTEPPSLEEILNKKSQPEGKELSEWISVEERLPNEGDANSNGNILCCNHVFTQIVNWDFQYLKSHMSHWMPLPNPPKQK